MIDLLSINNIFLGVLILLSIVSNLFVIEKIIELMNNQERRTLQSKLRENKKDIAPEGYGVWKCYKKCGNEYFFSSMAELVGLIEKHKCGRRITNPNINKKGEEKNAA